MKALTLARQFPLDFTLQYPPRRAYFQENFAAAVPGDLITDVKDFLLYAHVPFCAAKCFYCNFAVDVRNSDIRHDQYVDSLIQQLNGLRALMAPDARLHGIDIGGGTPTMLNNQNLARLMQALQSWLPMTSLEHPLSIETTPAIASLHPDRMRILREGGISRISMGIQSMNATTLQMVNRDLQVAATGKAVENLQAAGFNRINADLIFALPGQTREQWLSDLDAVIALGVDSITTYDCLYRGKGRVLTTRTAEKPSQDVYGALYDAAYERLHAAGYNAAYGSVNFSRHKGETGTSPYFEGRLHKHLPYIGAGNYSSTMVDDYWLFAPYAVEQWQKKIQAGDMLPVANGYRLPPAELMAKQILASLNFGTIDNQWFLKRFGVDIETAYPQSLSYAQAQGWMQKTGDIYGVVPGHFKHMPEIRSLFYSEQASDWLASLKGANTNPAPAPAPIPQTHGLVIGKFMPPHKGHDYLLTEAFNRSGGHLTVLVMGRATDPVPLELRTQWLKAVHPDKDIKFVKHDLPVNYNDPDLWQKWVDLIRQNTPQDITTVYASEDYGRELARRLKAVFEPVDPARSAYPISATMVREDFEARKDFITDEVYQWMKKNWKSGPSPAI